MSDEIVSSPELELSTSEQVSPDTQEQAEPIGGWEADKRWGSAWKSHSDTYNSYKNLEAKLKQQGDEIGKYKSQIDEFDQFKSKYEPYDQTIQFIEFLTQNPKYSPMLEKFVKDIEHQVKQERYGDLPDEFVTKLQRLDELENWRSQVEEEKTVSTYTQEINQTLSKIDSYAKSHGVEYDKSDFLSYCIKNEVPPKFMEAVFKDYAEPHIKELFKAKSQEEVLQNLNNNKRGSLLSSESRKKPPGTISKDEALLAALAK